MASPFLIASKLPDNQEIIYDNHKVKMKLQKWLNDGIIIFENKCFNFSVINESDIISLGSLNTKSDCVIPKIEEGLGTFLLKFIIYFCKDILKAKGIKLKDDSYFKCNGNKIDLALYSLYVNGETWYERFGFTPEKKDKLIKDKDKINNTKFLDLSLSTQNYISKLIEIDGSEKLSNIIKRIFDKDCEYYLLIADIIAIEIGLKRNVRGARFGTTYGEWILLF